MADRINLQITEVSEPKEVGQKGAKKLSFKAKDTQGKELSYFTFRTSLFDMIKAGSKIDAEVKIETREYDGNTYVDRQVNQIFIDGNPVGGQKGQWPGRGDSPEQRQSIETQVAVKVIAELRIANGLTDKSPEYQAMLAWCRERLGMIPQPSPQPAIATTNLIEQQVDSNPNILLLKDKDWLRESLEKIHYRQGTLLSWLRSKANYQGLDLTGEIEDIVGRMNLAQAEFLVKHIQSLLEVA